MPSYCVVKGCKSWNIRNEKIRFFSFPKDIYIKAQWIKACGNRYVNSRTARICSLHFTDKDWRLMDILLNTEMAKRVLNKNAIPTQLLPVSKTISSVAGQKVSNLYSLAKADIASSSFEAQIRKSDWNLEDPNTDRWHNVQLDFLNHVLLIWLNRSGKLKFIISDTMLRSKAKEAAKILDTFIVCSSTWIREFKDKLRNKDVRQPANNNPQQCDQSKDIADIIEEEWTRFRRKDDDSLSQCSQFGVKKETNPDIRSYEEALAIPLGEKSNVVESSIESYQEALDCLMMVKRYAFSVRNLSAVVIITELEDILKLECL